MPNPTRQQVEAYLAGLPADQQGPALEEIKRRMTAAPPSEPHTKEDFIKLADSLPKGSKEREDAINMATRLAEPGAAGTALSLTSMIPFAAQGVVRGGLGLVGAGLGGHVGKFLGGGIPIPGASKAGEIIGSVGGAMAGGIGGAGAIRSLAEAVPGYSGHLARAALKALGVGAAKAVPAAVAESASAPAVSSETAALLAQAEKQFARDPNMLKIARQAIMGEAAPAVAPVVKAVATPAARVLPTGTPDQIALRIQQLTGGKITPEMEAYMASLPEAEGATMRTALSRLQGRPAMTGGGPAAPGPEPTAPFDLEAALKETLKRRSAQRALQMQGEGVVSP